MQSVNAAIYLTPSPARILACYMPLFSLCQSVLLGLEPRTALTMGGIGGLFHCSYTSTQ